MKTRTAFLKRYLALALAVVLALSNVTPGMVINAHAAEDHVHAGEVIAENYELTDAEKDLLKSGYLAGDYEIEVPGVDNEWVAVDPEAKKITATGKNGWVATTAEILVGEESVETVTLTDGEGTYAYDGNAFSVAVSYVLDKNVDNQEKLLAAAGYLKQGVANTDAVSAQAGNLYILEQAMPELEKIAKEGVETGTGLGKLSFSDAGKAAVAALSAQMEANDGILDLTVMVNEYDAAASKVQYLITKGAAMQDKVEETAGNLVSIAEALKTIASMLKNLLDLGLIDQTTANQLNTVSGSVNNLKAGLDAVAADEWYAANNEVVTSADATLDALVAALGELTAVEVKNPLTVAENVANANMKMKNVTVTVVLEVVEDAADSDKLVEYGSKTEVIVLEEGASAQKIIAEAKDIVDAALAAWADEYVEGKFEVTASEVPETLTEDIEYTVIYSPKMFAVTGAIEMTVPYGYKLTLPVHPSAEQAYDYTVGGVAMAQGEIHTVFEDVVITRSSGKSYSNTDLYTVVADNFGDDITKNILKSGALNGNEAISYRKPDPADAESLLKLENSVLTAVGSYPAAYEDLDWVPYVYGYEGNINYYFNGVYEQQWMANSVKVQYALALTNFGQERAQEILDLAAQLKEEAEGQKSALDSLAGMEETLKMLDKTKLGALNGVIDVTDFTEGDETDTDAENLAIRADLKEVVGQIINNNVASNNYLKIYNMVVEYKADGLKYYYENYEAVKGEVELLASYMTELMDNEEALKIMCTAAGFPEYAEKISDVEGQLNDYNARLSTPNAAIDVESENLGKLVTALTAEGETSCIATGTPCILSEVLTATDSSQVLVQVMIETPNGNATVTTAAMDRGTVLTQTVIDDLKAKVAAKVDELLGGNNAYYVLATDGDLDALVNTALDAKKNIYNVYSYKEYTVVIEGEADQIVTIGDLEVNLPKHTEENWVYRYNVDGEEEITTSTYTFTVEQLDRLFTDGSYTITRVAVDEVAEKIEETFEEWLVKDGNGNVTGLYAKVNGNKDGIMGFAMTIVESGYSYIGLNGEEFLYLNEENTLEIKLQTLVNALLSDNDFSNETLIDLGKDGHGEFVHATMQLGNSKDDIHFEDLDFTLYLNSVPSQMATVANGLEKAEPYLTFNSEDGIMAVDVTLPEKVYEVYLAALLATGNIDKDDMEAINSEIAFQFLWDYVELIMATDADTVTYTNTLAKLGIDRDLTGAEDYYQLVKKALNNEGLVINPEDDNTLVDMSATAKSQKAINALIDLLGVDVSAYETYLGMIYEYKYDYAEIYAAATVELTNTDKNFEAALLDIRHSVESKVDYLKKFDFTDNLPERAKSIAGEAVIMLLDDVHGDLVFNDATVLDLNGNTVYGNIVANGTTLIFDSSLDTYNCGGVTGTVSGNATVVGGKYTSDVTAFLPDGYEVENGTVRNILYTIAENGGNVSFAADADIISKDVASYTEAAAMIAADMALDLVLNYFTAASLEADGYSIYNITVSDIIGIYDSTNRKEALINTALDFVSLAELNGFINNVIDKMLDFAAIEAAIDADENVLSFDVTVAPWSVSVDHITDGDYVTFGVEPNEELETTFTVGLKMAGSDAKKEYAANLVGGLSDIVDTADADVEILKPSYSNKELTVSGKGSATLIIDVTKDNNTANDTAYGYKEYVNVLAVVFANGVTDSAKADALVAAIGDDEAMKAAIDALTVKDVFDALKNMSVANTFDKMVKDLGITADLGDAAELEAIYHLIANAAGEGLEYLEITGPSRTLGSLWNENTGYYEWSTTRSVERDITRRGYTLTVGAEIEEVTLKVKLFGEEDHTHTPGTEVIENEVSATCDTEGSYDKVVYCSECGEELSRETVVVPALGHTAGAEVIENNVPATCDTAGSYDKVVYCEVCGDEVSRETVTVPALGHTVTPAVVENKVDATCTTDGSYDSVVYCGVCGKELSRETVTVPATGHTAGEEVIENNVDATCETEGSYDKVVYCTECGEELSRETVVVPALGHKHVYEITKQPTCTEQGERKITCENCDYEKFEAIEALGHLWGNWVVIKPATETSMGLQKRCCERCDACETRVTPMLPSDDREDEENPGTGAFVAAGSAIIALATLIGTAFVTEKNKRR